MEKRKHKFLCTVIFVEICVICIICAKLQKNIDIVRDIS